MHYHINKDETWYVESGRFAYRRIDTNTAEIKENLLKPGDIVRQRPGQPHQLECLNSEGRIFEVSTHHSDDDKISLAAIKKGIPYVGVIASKKKADLIKEYLQQNNVSDSEIKNLYSPTGLDLNAKTPEQIALSILSEIVMLDNQGTGKQMATAEKTDQS